MKEEYASGKSSRELTEVLLRLPLNTNLHSPIAEFNEDKERTAKHNADTQSSSEQFSLTVKNTNTLGKTKGGSHL